MYIIQNEYSSVYDFKFFSNLKLIAANSLSPINWIRHYKPYLLDTEGSSQMILPMPNLEITYYFDKKSETVL